MFGFWGWPLPSRFSTSLRSLDIRFLLYFRRRNKITQANQIAIPRLNSRMVSGVGLGFSVGVGMALPSAGAGRQIGVSGIINRCDFNVMQDRNSHI